MMRLKKNIFLTAIGVGLAMFSCEDALEPRPENVYELDGALSHPGYAEGFLLKVYKGLPKKYDFVADYACDDAVTNDEGSDANAMNGGGWTAEKDPVGTYNKAYEMIAYLNTFIENIDTVVWAYTYPNQYRLFRKKHTGEAHALRAWYYFSLLQKHAGEGTNGELLGVPIVDRVLTAKDDLEIPRATFKECVDFILADCQIGIDSLELRWVDKKTQNPDKTTNQDAVDHNVTNGARNKNRINGIAARLLKARVLLYAASPAYAAASGYTWEDAALAAADVITQNGGLGTLKAGDLNFYSNINSGELLWYSSKESGKADWEEDHFPPSHYGKGKLNPTQDLVEAFPMSDGTPIGQSEDFNPVNPYNDRDPRLNAYIVFNGSSFKGSSIYTHEAATDNGPDLSDNASRTSYYLRKFLQISKVELTPGSEIKNGVHYYTYARFTEALLNFAEAANEVGDPDATIGGYSAREVINAIRDRAGITSHDFVDDLDQQGMRTLIRNERRLELCFEGHRFYDIRRWKDFSTMKKSVSGVLISEDQTTYTVREIEERIYADFQIYGPIPRAETLKYGIVQNRGW